MRKTNEQIARDFYSFDVKSLLEGIKILSHEVDASNLPVAIEIDGQVERNFKLELEKVQQMTESGMIEHYRFLLSNHNIKPCEN